MPIELRPAFGGSNGIPNDAGKPINKMGFKAFVKKKLERPENNALELMGKIAHPIQEKYEELKEKKRTNWGPEVTGTAEYVKGRVETVVRDTRNALGDLYKVAKGIVKNTLPFDSQSKKTSKVKTSEAQVEDAKIVKGRGYLSQINAINLQLAKKGESGDEFKTLDPERRTLLGEFNHLGLSDDEKKTVGMEVVPSLTGRGEGVEKFQAESVRQEVKLRLKMFNDNPTKKNGFALCQLMDRISKSGMEGVRQPCRTILKNKKLYDALVPSLAGQKEIQLFTLKTELDLPPKDENGKRMKE